MFIKNVGYYLICFTLVIYLFSGVSVSASEANSSRAYSQLLPEPVILQLQSTNSSIAQVLRFNFDLADSFFLAGDLNNACLYYEKSLAIASQINHSWSKIICYNRLGFTHYWLNKIPESASYYSKSVSEIKLAKDIADSIAFMEAFLFLRITENMVSPKITEELDCYYLNHKTSVKSISNKKRQTKFYFLESKYAIFRDDFLELKSVLGKYKSLLDEQENVPKIWSFYYNLFLADFYTSMSDYPLALQYYNRLEKQVRENSQFQPYRNTILKEVCRFHYLFYEYEKAGEYIDELISLLGTQYFSYNYYDFLLIGYVYQKLGNYDKALLFYNRAKTILQNLKIQDKRLVLVYWFLAEYYNSVMQNSEKELYYLNNALKILNNFPDRYLESFIIRMKGGLFLKTDGLQVIRLYNSYLFDLEKLLSDATYFQNQYPFLHRSDYLSVLRGRGRTYYYLSLNHNNDTIFLRKSYNDYKSLLELSLKLFNRVGFEDSKISALNRIRSYYNAVFNVGYSLYEQTGNQKLLNELFNYAEDSKAYLLKNYLSEGLKRKMAGISEDELETANNLKKEVDTLLYLASRMGNNIDSDEGYLIEKILQKSKHHDDYILQLESKYPGYAALRNEKSPITIKQVQDCLKPSQCLIEYFFTHNAFYTIFISVDTAGIVYKPIDSDFVSTLQQFMKNFQEYSPINFEQSNIDTFTYQSYKIYRLAIEPIKKQIKDKDLLIIADAELGQVPFETLVTKDPRLNSFRSFVELPYLLKENSVSYLYSVSQVIKKQTKRKFRASFAGFAPQYVNNNSQANIYADLPGAKEELKSARRYFGGRIWLGKKATKERYFKAAGTKDIVHLAMHTEININDPRLSRLLFSPDIHNDKLQLHTHEVYSRPIQSSLVVLSACNTGRGKINRGEGIFSLARSFLMAGISNVIYTQWSVNDQSSALIMNSFYQNLAKGKSVDKAIQQAKLDFLIKGDPVKAHPYFWAGYVNMGVPVTIPSNKLYNILGFCVLVVLIFFLIYKLYRYIKF